MASHDGDGDENGLRRRVPPQTNRYTKCLVLVCINLSNLVCHSVYSVLASFFPQEARAKGLSDEPIGFVFAVFAAVIFVSAPFVSTALNTHGKRAVYVSGQAIVAVGTMLFALANQIDNLPAYFTWCFVLRCVQGFGSALEETAAYALIAEIDPEAVSFNLGVTEISTGLGYMIGPTVGGLLFSAGGFALPFITIGVALIPAMLLIIWIVPDDRAGGRQQAAAREDAGSSTPIRQLLARPQILIIALTAILGNSDYAFLEPTLAGHVESLASSSTAVGMLFSVTSLTYTVSAPLMGWLSHKDRMGPRNVIIWGARAPRGRRRGSGLSPGRLRISGWRERARRMGWLVHAAWLELSQARGQCLTRSSMPRSHAPAPPSARAPGIAFQAAGFLLIGPSPLLPFGPSAAESMSLGMLCFSLFLFGLGESMSMTPLMEDMMCARRGRSRCARARARAAAGCGPWLSAGQKQPTSAALPSAPGSAAPVRPNRESLPQAVVLGPQGRRDQRALGSDDQLLLSRADDRPAARLLPRRAHRLQVGVHAARARAHRAHRGPLLHATALEAAPGGLGVWHAHRPKFALGARRRRVGAGRAQPGRGWRRARQAAQRLRRGHGRRGRHALERGREATTQVADLAVSSCAVRRAGVLASASVTQLVGSAIQDYCILLIRSDG